MRFFSALAFIYSKRDRFEKTLIEFADDLEIDQWYHARTAGVVFRPVAKDLTLNEAKGFFEGTVTVEYAAGEGEETLTAEGIRSMGLPDEVVSVPNRVVTDPERILVELAEHELNQYRSTLGLSHPFNGVNGVESVGDLVAAERVRDNRRRVGEA